MTQVERIAFSGRQTRHDAVPHAGWGRVGDATTTPLEPHDHGAAYEVCLIVSGEVEWWVGEEVHTVGPGRVYLTRPGEVHGGVGEVIQPAELYWMGFSLPGKRGAMGLSLAEANQLAGRFAAMTRRTFPADPAMRHTFARLIAAMQSEGPLTAWQVRAAVLQLATATLIAHDTPHSDRPEPSREIRGVMRWIVSHLDQEISIDDMADRAGLAVSRFHERFTQETGFSPGDWRNRQRIAAAKRWLRTTDRPVTWIAMRVGFSSSQYFATAFKRWVGVSPSAYRRRFESSPPAPG